jgi:hypothetical protein
MTTLSIDTHFLDDPRIQTLTDADFRSYFTLLAAEAVCGRGRFNMCAMRFALGVSTPELWGIVNRLKAAGLCDVEPGEGLHHPEALAYAPTNDALKAGAWPSNFKAVVRQKGVRRSGASSTTEAA